ncbi:reverse transcriptase [Phytophthora megakarya]|uniref:Reverse transcriptase n=1 Tax=Phytophthora megakarya TaxID=4795 RepID=A0A225WH69_9STRA|nr:reverse transcriptase [Phytophthora megakarya]
MQSFLGSLNYYSRFIEDYAIYASVLYELREVKFAELEKRSDLRKIMGQNDPIALDNSTPELQPAEPLDGRWIRAHKAFIALKTKVATTPILRHFDETRTPEIIVYASDWAISASLTQEHDGTYHPAAFTSRTLETNELNYNMTEKEVLALLRILDLYYKLLVGREIRVVTGHSTLVWLFKSAGLQGRLGQWSALLAPWTLEITKCGIGVQGGPEHQDHDLVTLNRLDEILIPKTENPVAQEEEVWITGMKKYLSGSIADLTQAEARSYGKIAADYEVDEQDLLFYGPPTPRSGDDRDRLLRLVVPETLQSDVLHHYHTTLEVVLFTGYVIAKASSSRSAQTIAESYEECVFRRFGASEMIRHDREPGFMSAFFRSLNNILGQRQRATMAYRPPDDGTAESVAHTATRALKMYVRDMDQKDWDEYAERLTFAINTAQDQIRGDTPHYLGCARKLAHLWHGPFCAAEKISEFTIKLEIAGIGYRIFPVVHVSKLKLVKDFPDRPQVELTVSESDRLDFDEILLQEDSWVPDLGADEYEIGRISDVRSGKKTRFSRVYREFLVHWVGYDEPTWVDEADLNCGAILNAFLRKWVNHNRFSVMQSHEEM